MGKKKSLYDWDEQSIREAVSSSTNYTETMKKLNIPYNNRSTLQKKIDEYNIDISHFTFKPQKHNLNYVPAKEYLTENSHIRQQDLKKKLIKEGYKEDRCEECGCPNIWNGKPITLQLHHINGNSSDNRLENLQILCPNCHSQTDTFTGRNSDNSRIVYKCSICGKETSKGRTICPECSYKQRRIPCPLSKDELIQEFINNPNITYIGNKYGASDRVTRRWFKDFGLPTSSKELKELLCK